MDKIEAQVEQFLLAHDKTLVSLVYELRDFFKSTTKPKFELMAESVSSVNFGYSFSQKAWDSYCAIIVYNKHVNISFPSGAMLEDPKNLLVGTGKRVRHIRIDNMQQLNDTGLIDLINEAREFALSKLKEQFVFDSDVHPIKRLKSSSNN